MNFNNENEIKFYFHNSYKIIFSRNKITININIYRFSIINSNKKL